MSDIDRKIDSIDRKLKKLISGYQDQKQLNRKLKNEQIRQQEELSAKINELKHSQDKEKIGKIVQSISENPQKATDLKLLINEQLREIDKCIAYLNQ